ncbi:hypothetical protein HAX54_031882 [Datura stramonium]|uniref:Uncharacterized protein n=1 Tax=Datura stramonium TaxID=4076 RepID=A0ABS8V9W6_DATST|nr:hypothetical protein [Datura stramonium]
MPDSEPPVWKAVVGLQPEIQFKERSRGGPRCSENIKYIIFGCQRLNTALEFWQLAFLHDSSEVAPAHIVWNLEDLITGRIIAVPSMDWGKFSVPFTDLVYSFWFLMVSWALHRQSPHSARSCGVLRLRLDDIGPCEHICFRIVLLWGCWRGEWRLRL